MGAIRAVLTEISNDVVAALAAAGYPPLSLGPNGETGQIWVGPAATYENLTAPRIVFEPVSSTFGAPWFSNGRKSAVAAKNFATFRPILGEALTFKVRCWGKGVDNDPADDFDVTRAIYHQIIASLQKLIPGAFKVEASGSWTESGVERYGREFVFSVTIDTPVVDTLAPYSFVNRTTAQQAEAVDYLHADALVASGLTLDLDDEVEFEPPDPDPPT